jgi:hypothetical protein
VSEHRSRYSSRSDLFDGRCQFWPDCTCHETLKHWQDVLPNNRFSFEALQWAETAIFLALSCVEAHCPSRKHREFAQVQLLNPWWDRQRRGEEMSREFFKRLQEED